MPTPLEQTIAIILDPVSKLREINPLVYQIPSTSITEHESKIRYCDLVDGDLSKSMSCSPVIQSADEFTHFPILLISQF